MYKKSVSGMINILVYIAVIVGFVVCLGFELRGNLYINFYYLEVVIWKWGYYV